MSAGEIGEMLTALRAIWREGNCAEISFSDGEVLTASGVGPPFEGGGGWLVDYVLQGTNRPEKYAAFGAPPYAAYVARLDEIRSVRVLPHAADAVADGAEESA